MNIFHKVTLATLRKNKVRTVVTIIGIILSAAMICAVTTMASSVQNYLLKNYEYVDGSWHGSVREADKATLDQISFSDEVANSVYSQYIGYVIAQNCKNESKPYLYLIGASVGFENIMPVHITAGTYPKNQTEILLPAHLLDNGGVSHKLGDVLTLEIGDRIRDGEIMLGQNNPFYTYDESGEETEVGEVLEVRQTRTFTVVGFYERPSFEEYWAPGYTAITVADATPAEGGIYSVYFQMENPKDVYSFIEKNELLGIANTDVLMFLGVSRYVNFSVVLYGLAAIVIALIMFGSISLIYNAFSISVSERTKQFGLFSSIGATKKQLRKMVLFEALAVSAVGIPLGILAGVGGIGVTLLLIGDKFAVFGTSFSIPMRLNISPAAIVIACVVALVTVLISAWIPSVRATKVSAVEAIRQNTDIKAKNGKSAKTSKLTYKLFGLSGVLASKHFKRNRKKYRATVVSLFMSIVLFVSASAFTGYLMRSVDSAFSTAGYDLEFYDYQATVPAKELLNKLNQAKGVTRGTYVYANTSNVNLPNTYLNEEWRNYGVGAGAYVEGLDQDVYTHAIVRLVFVEEETYKAYLKENRLDESLYLNAEKPTAVALDGNTLFHSKEEKFMTINMLKENPGEMTTEFVKDIEGYYFDSIVTVNGEEMCKYIEVTQEGEELLIPKEEAYIKQTLNIGTVLYEKPYFVEDTSYLILLYPESCMEAVMAERDTTNYATFYFSSDDHKTSYEDMKTILTDQGLSTSQLYDYAQMAESNRDIVMIIRVFSYGFIILISLISAANVFNTISTNISLRRREFAMLKSVGMTKKGFQKMMNFECLLYGTKALLFGLPVAVGITYLIYLVVSEGVATGFYLPWAAIGIAVLSVFAVVFVTMMYAMSKIKKENPIDALKNENL